MPKITANQGASLTGQFGAPGDLSSTGADLAAQAGLGLLGGAGMVAVRAADLAWPARPDAGGDEGTALTVAGAGKIVTGDLVVFCKPVVASPGARPGRVRGAGAHHPRVLRHIDRGDPLMNPLMFLIVNHLRSAHPRPPILDSYR